MNNTRFVSAILLFFYDRLNKIYQFFATYSRINLINSIKKIADYQEIKKIYSQKNLQRKICTIFFSLYKTFLFYKQIARLCTIKYISKPASQETLKMVCPCFYEREFQYKYLLTYNSLAFNIY